MFDKLLEKKGKKPLDETYKSAKMATLKNLRDEMSGMMKDDLSNAKGMKKVEVAGSDPDALAAGLDKAKEMVTSAPGADTGAADAGSNDDDSSGDDASDSDAGKDGGEDTATSLIEELVDHEVSEGDLDADKIDQIIQMLQQKKEQLSSGSGEMTPSLDKMVGKI